MRLHRLTLRNVRGVEERTVTLASAGTDTGVIIVEGLNEAGKSTLGDALDVLLTYKDSSRHSDVRSLQSAGREEPPEVEAELDLGGHRFTYHKRYLKRTATTLTLSAPRGEQLSGDAAHDRVDALLHEHLDVALWSSLRLRQADGLAQTAPGHARGLATALAEHSDVSAIGDRELTVLQRVQEEYERYFTAKAGTPKPLLREAAATVQDLTEQLATIEDRRASLTADIDRADRLARSLPALRSQVTETAAQAEEHAARRAEVAALAEQVERLRDVAQQAEATLERLEERRRRRTALTEELAEVTAAQQERTTALAAAQAQQRDLEDRLERARTELEAAQDRQRDARRARELAQRDLDLLGQQQALSRSRARAERAAAALARRRDAEATTTEITLDDAGLDDLRAAQHELTRARAALDAASPQLRFTAERAVGLLADGESMELAPGERARWPVQGTFSLRIEEVGEVEVLAGAGIDDAAEAHRLAAEELRAGLERAGVADLAAAELAVRRRREAERTIAEAQRERETALEGQAAEDLDEEVDRLERTVTRELSARDATAPLPDSIAAARTALEAAGAAERDADEGVAGPAAEVESAREALERDRAHAIELTTRCSEADDRLAAIRAELVEARDRSSDEDLAAELAAAEEARAAAHAAADTAAASLAAADPDAVTELADNAAAVVADARGRLQAAEQDLRDTRVRISALGGDGLWEQREAVATELTHAQTALLGLQRRAEAARTLRDTLERHRLQARDRYAAPLREQLVVYGRMLYGPEFDLELDDDLRIARRYLGGLWLDVTQLSVGAREQLALLGRLACASLLGAHGGVLLFDDALGNTDPDRLERLGAVLRSAGQHAQVIVLTSYPDRYRHVGGATRIAL
ncbi:MAG: AAA family ATPase [Nitriliruptoraceae bacterium]